MEWIGLIWLRIGTSGGLLWIQYWTFGFHKMLGSSWGTAQLTAPQEVERPALLTAVREVPLPATARWTHHGRGAATESGISGCCVHHSKELVSLVIVLHLSFPISNSSRGQLLHYSNNRGNRAQGIIYLFVGFLTTLLQAGLHRIEWRND
jgi:hypothetical protein